jgi:hypothetical protein
MKKRFHLRDSQAVLLLAALTLIFYSRALLSGHTLAFDDIQRYFFPVRHLLYTMAHGQGLYFWNPYFYGGMPLAGDIQTAMFFPANLLFYLIDTPLAILLHQIMMVFLASLFMYLYLRELSFTEPAAFIASLLYAFSGTFIVHSFHLTMIDCFAVYPLVFYCGEKTLKTMSIFWAAISGISLALDFLAGFPQMTALLITVYIPYMIAGFIEQKTGGRLRLLGLSVIIALIAMLISSVQFFPTLELMTRSLRTRPPTMELLRSQALTLSSLPLLVVPDIYGNVLNSTYRGHLHFWEECHYIGVVALIFAGLGIGRKRNRVHSYFIFLACFSVLISIGYGNPLFSLLQKSIPTIGFFRNPARNMIFFVFAMVFFSALGIERILCRDISRGAIRGLFVAMTAIIIAACFGCSGSWTGGLLTGVILGLITISLILIHFRKELSPTAVFASLALLSLGSLWSFGLSWNIEVPNGYYRDPLPVFRRFQSPEVTTRVFYLPPPDLWDTVNMGSLYGIANIQGYNVSIPEDTVRYMQAAQGVLRLDEDLKRSYEILAFSRKDNLLTDLLSSACEIKGRVTETGAVFELSKSPKSLPRAFLAPGYRVEKDRQRILEMLYQGEIDVRKCVILEEPVQGTGQQEHFDGDAQVTYLAQGPDYQKLRVTSRSRGIVFLSEVYFPGWKAYVDGREERIYRSNFLFRAVPVSSGEHILEFHYRPDSLRIGGFLTCLGILISFLIFALHFHGKRHHDMQKALQAAIPLPEEQDSYDGEDKER